MPSHGTTQAYQDIYGPEKGQIVSLSLSSSGDDEPRKSEALEAESTNENNQPPLVVTLMKLLKSGWRDFGRKREGGRKRPIRKKLFHPYLFMVKTYLNFPRLEGWSIIALLMIGELT